MTHKSLDELVADLADCHGAIQAADEYLLQTAPQLHKDVAVARAKIPELEEGIKAILRATGPGTRSILGHSFQVRTPPLKAEVDIDDITEKAEKEGDVRRLLEYGFLKYAAAPFQLERLPPDLQLKYGEYVRIVEGTPSVVLPPEFK